MEIKEKNERKISILVAEDDKEVAASLFNILSDRNLDVSLSYDGEAALSELKKRQFDIMILDLKLPKVGGFEILAYIKNNELSTKVIVLTAYSDLKSEKISKNLGAEHVMGKPYDIEMLFWAIDMVLSKN